MSKSDKLLLICIFAIGAIVMLPTLKLGLYGDDWLAFYRYNYHLGKWSNGDFNFITYFLTPYGAQDILMGTLKSIWGLNPTNYFILSFILRFGVSISIFFLVKKYLDNKVSAFISALFFVITSVGIETTNWVFNMPSFLALIFVSAFLYNYFFSIESKKSNHIIFSSLFFYLAYITAPIRLHGFLPFIIIFEIYILILTKDFRTTLKRLASIIIAFYLIKISGQSLGVQEDMVSRIRTGSQILINEFKNGRLLFATNPFLTAGRIFFPESVWSFFEENFEVKRILHSVYVSVSLFIPFLFLIPTYQKSIRKNNLVLFLVITMSIIWTLVIKYIKGTIPAEQINYTHLSQSLLGGYMLIYFISLTLFAKEIRLKVLFFFGIIWVFTSYVSAWFATPDVSFSTNHRYMIIPAYSLSILLGALYFAAKEKNSKILISIILIVYFSLHLFATKAYFDQLLILRSKVVSEKIRNSLPEIPLSTFESPVIIYFEGENTLLYNTLTFGFPPYISIIKNTKDTNLIPTATSNWDEVLVAAKTGENMKAYGFETKPVLIENIYSFRVNNNGTLDNSSQETRNKLELLIQAE